MSAEVKDALIGVGIAMIIFYFLIITLVKSIDELLFNIVMDFGILIAGILTIIVALTYPEN